MKTCRNSGSFGTSRSAWHLLKLNPAAQNFESTGRSKLAAALAMVFRTSPGLMRDASQRCGISQWLFTLLTVPSRSNWSVPVGYVESTAYSFSVSAQSLINLSSQSCVKTVWASICMQKSSMASRSFNNNGWCARANTGPRAFRCPMRSMRTRDAGSQRAKDSAVYRLWPQRSSSSCNSCISLRLLNAAFSSKGVPKPSQSSSRASLSPRAFCCTTPAKTREGTRARSNIDLSVAASRVSRNAAISTTMLATSLTATSWKSCKGGWGCALM
mmetsp:Transcript_115636/g.326912  ORF Transcript_115636/g.326912 Transcript_115636/m.326912 type:complete len:271 (+) Transcript_115636:764-1576(+)